MRITDLLHRETESTAKKLARRSAWVATIAVNGKVTLSHARHETIHLDSRDEVQTFISDNGLDEFEVLIVDIVNAKGEPPIEL